MKKTLGFGILAICCIALSHQQASAWTNQKFSFGMEWQRQSGGNNFCRIWQNGQPPGPETFGFAPSYYHSTPAAPTAPAAPKTTSSASFDAFDFGAPAYAMPVQPYTPFQFATYPHATFEYPSVYSGR